MTTTNKFKNLIEFLILTPNNDRTKHSNKFSINTTSKTINSILMKLTASTVFLVSSYISASVIVERRLEPNSSGEFSNLGPSNQQVADDFILNEPIILKYISWYGRYWADFPDINAPISFSIRIFMSNGSEPQSFPIADFDIEASAVGTGSVFQGPECAGNLCHWLLYSTELPNITLQPGNYWISIIETDPRTELIGISQWLWADTDSIGLRSTRASDGSVWDTALDIDHAFILDGKLSIGIDIKPESTNNCLNINDNGVIPVSILGDEYLDVYKIQKTTLSFSGLKVRIKGNHKTSCNFQDTNKDGYTDLLCHFEDNISLWRPNNGGTATVEGILVDGTEFEGTDSFCSVP